MVHDTLRPHFEALLERSLPDGSFAMAAGAASRPDATAWAALALHAANLAPEKVAAARSSLAARQSADGRVAVLPERPEAAWPTTLALLAWLPDPQFAQQARTAARWLAEHAGAHWPRQKDGIFGHDTDLVGWPWIDGTHSWVEPTALAMLALAATQQAPTARIDAAVRLLLDRQLPDGGWNYGNTRVFRHMLLPVPESTGHALAGLAGRTERGTVAVSLAYLAGPQCNAPTPLSAAWRAFGLAAWDEASPAVLENLVAALSRQDRFGPYDTPLLAQLLAAAASGGHFSALTCSRSHERV